MVGGGGEALLNEQSSLWGHVADGDCWCPGTAIAKGREADAPTTGVDSLSPAGQRPQSKCRRAVLPLRLWGDPSLSLPASEGLLCPLAGAC